MLDNPLDLVEASRVNIQRLLLEHPQLNDYFYKRKELEPKTPQDRATRAQVYATCEIILINFGIIARHWDRSQGKPDVQWDHHVQSAKRLFENSPTLQRFYGQHKGEFHPSIAKILQ